MAPLFFFLASSFNVELVYIILKGITQFTYLTCNNGQCSFTNAKAAKLNLQTLQDGSKVLTMKEIKIKDFHKWSEIKTSDVKDDETQSEKENKRDENDVEGIAPS